MPWLLKRLFRGDGALVDLQSHWDTKFFSGHRLANPLGVPVELDIDLDSDGRRMPTFFTTPAFIARRAFFEWLRAAGVDNIEACPAIIRNRESGESFEDYLVLNILGRVSCADLGANPGVELGPGIRVLDEPVIVRSAMRDFLMFLLAEDPLQIILADSLAEQLRASGIDDIYLEPLDTV